MRDINVAVVCPQPGMENVLIKIREWCRTGTDPACANSVSGVFKALDLEKAIASARGSSAKNVLIPIGFEPSDVRRLLNDQELRKFEVIIRPPRTTSVRREIEVDEMPTSSLLSDSFIVNVQDPIKALRKSILRLQLRDWLKIRALKSIDDFEQYFSLRYRVWKALNYLPADRDCQNSKLELDFTDRTALPIGAFTNDGRLIGCARLVRPLGDEIPQFVSTIQKLVSENGDTALRRNLEYPNGLSHPFDLLESFAGFRNYYSKIVRQGVKKGEISRVIVAPEERHQGLGEVLVDSLVSIACTNHLQLLFLACHGRHQRFYENCGFHILEGLKCDKFAGVNAPAIAMACELSLSLRSARSFH